MRMSLNGSDWLVQGWMPQEWELVGVRKLVTANLEIGSMLHGETGLLPATVPGCVHADLLRSGVIEDPYVDFNSRKCEWVEHRNWLYQKTFTLPPEAKGRKLRLIFHGIDYSARAWLNGELLGRHTGTFITAEFDVTKAAKIGENHLAVMFDPIPDVPGQVGYSNQVKHLKPRFGYKWDFTTRLVQFGLWDDVEIAATGPAHIDNVQVLTNLSRDGARVSVQTALVSEPSVRARIAVRIRLGDEAVVAGESEVDIEQGKTISHVQLELHEPKLWWPNGLGEQPVYIAEVSLLGPDGEEWDTCSTAFGLRTIEAAQNEAAPKGADPYTLVVNGRKVFLKGWNFVPVDHMYGLPNEEKYDWLIDLARRAHVNMLRVWGGGIIEKKLFYDLCDRAGILVWQEMPQSSSGLSNDPPTEPGFLETLKTTARAALRRRRNHPCLAVWGGGNELADGLKPLDITHPNLAAIGEVVSEEAPHLIYRPTSPYGPSYDLNPANARSGVHHDVHGPWQYQGVDGHYELFNIGDCLFHSEAGAEGCASVQSIGRCLRDEDSWPPDKTNRAWVHHAGWWVNADDVRAHFGPIESLEDFVMASQFLQAEAVRYAVEASRRRKFKCSASLLWQMNEPWPNVSATTCVDYYGLPKPAYYFASRAFEPRHISLKYWQLYAADDTPLEGEMFVHNSLDAIDRAEAVCRIFDSRGKLLSERSKRVTVPENACVSAGAFEWAHPAGVDILIVRLELNIDGKLTSRNEYVFPVGDPFVSKTPILAPLANQPMTSVDLHSREKTDGGGVVRVINNGDAAALMTMIEPDERTKLHVDGNVRMLLPGEVAEFLLTMRRDSPAPSRSYVTIRAWNAVDLVLNM
ncbi:MAG: hypothetical protein HQ592_05490 [Planctomycetes bacterium]|nr:hypothetical protein [Planctomycetota bacterium]